VGQRPIVIHNQEEGKSRGPLTALKRIVTIPRKLNMDHLKVQRTTRKHINYGERGTQ